MTFDTVISFDNSLATIFYIPVQINSLFLTQQSKLIKKLKELEVKVSIRWYVLLFLLHYRFDLYLNFTILMPDLNSLFFLIVRDGVFLSSPTERDSSRSIRNLILLTLQLIPTSSIYKYLQVFLPAFVLLRFHLNLSLPMSSLC